MPKRNALTFFLVVFVLVAIYFVYYFQYRTVAAPFIQPSLKETKSATAATKDKYVAGEVIVKLKQPINEFTKKTFVNPDSRNASMEYVALNKTQLPKVVNDMNKKYHLKTIQKAFPVAAIPALEIQKIRKSFNENPDTKSSSFDEEKVKTNDLSRIYNFKIDDNANIQDVVNELKSDPDVEYAEPNYETTSELTPNDPLFMTTPNVVNQWGLYNPGGPAGFVKGADVKALDAWNITRGSPNIIIAVADSGIDYRHPDLGGGFGASYKVMGGYDFVNNDSDPMDDNGHGTHIAGIIAATVNNSQGIVGVCPLCKLMAVKTQAADGYGSNLRGANAIYYAADHGAKVISISWGNHVYSETLKAAIDAAELKGVIVVAAAGNNGTSEKFYPAAYTNVIGVASTDPNDAKRVSSNFDDGTKWVKIAAPGSNIRSTALAGTGGLCRSGNTTRYAYCSGTSMAAPFVAGAVGIYESIHPVTSQTTGVNTRTRITSSTYADNINTINPAYANKLGAGRLNMYKLLTVNASFCADTDWGDNANVGGYVTGDAIASKCGAAGLKTYDTCNTTNTSTSPSWFYEGVCTSSLYCAKVVHTCKGGCGNGVCLY
jgi:thermitase